MCIILVEMLSSFVFLMLQRFLVIKAKDLEVKYEKRSIKPKEGAMFYVEKGKLSFSKT